MKLQVFGVANLPVTTFSSDFKFRFLLNSTSFRWADMTYLCALIFLKLNVFIANGFGCPAKKFDDVRCVWWSTDAIESLTIGLRIFKSFRSISASSCSRGWTRKDPSMTVVGMVILRTTDVWGSFDFDVIGASGGGELVCASGMNVGWSRIAIVRHGPAFGWIDVIVAFGNVGGCCCCCFSTSSCLRLRRRGAALLLE